MAGSFITKINTINTAGTSAEYEIIATSGATSALQVDNATDVYNATNATKATKALMAQGINSTNTVKFGGDLSGDNLVGTAISAAKTINTRITNVPWKAISSTTDASGSKTTVTSGTADSTWSATNAKFLTPDIVKGYVDKKTSALAEDAGIYQVKGNSTFANLTDATAHHNGFVYNITTTGSIPAASAYNGQTFEVYEGDNLVYLTGGTQAGWDKLGDIFAEARSTLKPYSAASADMDKFNSMYATITNTTNGSASWNNSAHNLFAGVNTPGGNVSATVYNSTLTLSSLAGVSAGGTSPTATFGMSGISAFKTFKITKADGTTVQYVPASTFADEMKFVAGTKITLTPTVDENGNPTITINKTDTTAKVATSAENGLVKKSYYSETDTTNHVGKLIVQGNM